jgi:ABC-2 type transport system permease protein
MIMNFLVMPLYFLSGAMFPLASAPAWMKSLMTVDPLTYGVDALRNVLYSGTTIRVGGMTVPLAEMARRAGLVRWELGFDALVMAAAALLLAAAAAYRFNRAE